MYFIDQFRDINALSDEIALNRINNKSGTQAKYFVYNNRIVNFFCRASN